MKIQNPPEKKKKISVLGKKRRKKAIPIPQASFQKPKRTLIQAGRYGSVPSTNNGTSIKHTRNIKSKLPNQYLIQTK